jgi:hypothetical protein
LPDDRSAPTITELELGLDTFGDVTFGDDGHPLTHAEVIRNLVQEALFADTLEIYFISGRR